MKCYVVFGNDGACQVKASIHWKCSNRGFLIIEKYVEHRLLSGACLGFTTISEPQLSQRQKYLWKSQNFPSREYLIEFH